MSAVATIEISARETIRSQNIGVDPGKSLKLVVLGLSITSSWGNGHATTYRGLLSELSKRGHEILFLERDVEWYACNRDLPEP